MVHAEGCNRLRDFADDSSESSEHLYRCEHGFIWQALKETLYSGMSSLFIRATPRAVISSDRYSSCRDGVPEGEEDTNVLFDTVFNNYGFATSGPTSVLYPDILHDFVIPADRRLLFNLVNGRYIFEGRYPDNIQACGDRHTFFLGSKQMHAPLKTPLDFQALPCSEPFTVELRASSRPQRRFDGRERVAVGDDIQIDCRIGVGGTSYPVSLEKQTYLIFETKISTPCSHPTSTPLVDC